MHHLDISKIRLGDDGFVAIASCLNNIDVLFAGRPDNRELSMKGILALSENLQKRNIPVLFVLLF